MKRYSFSFLLSIFALYASSQSDPVLMRINDEEIRRSEFEHYYNKNNETSQAKLYPRDYADIFINNKLKIAEAKLLGLDTLPAFRSEFNAFNRQLTREYLSGKIEDESHLRQVYEQRKSKGKSDVVQGHHIFKRLPQNTSASQVNKIVGEMDSLYRRVVNDSSVDFTEIVNAYSDDKSPFSISRYQSVEEFEKIVFQMNAGEVSQPFFTPQGIHIVKLTVKDNPDYENAYDGIRGQYDNKKNVSAGKTDRAFLEKLKQEHNYSPVQPAIDELLATGKARGVLFTIDGKSYSMDDFELFSSDNPASSRKRVNDFIAKSLYDYESNLLSVKYPGINWALEEFRDNILLSEINEKELQEPLADIAGLKAYFDVNKKKYYWELPRYKGIVVHCESKKISRQIKKQLRKLRPEQWANVINTNYNQTGQKVIVEEGTFAVGQNDYVDKKIFKVGKFTPLETHPYSETLGKKIKGPESYEEIFDVVAADYRNYLETSWIDRLRKKSKVEINEEVLKTVNNH